jgi:hypothetical protein
MYPNGHTTPSTEPESSPVRSASMTREVHVGEPKFGAAAAGHLHHGRREDGGNQAAGLAGDSGRFEAGVARPRRQLEQRVAGCGPCSRISHARTGATASSRCARHRSQPGAIAWLIW